MAASCSLPAHEGVAMEQGGHIGGSSLSWQATLHPLVLHIAVLNPMSGGSPSHMPKLNLPEMEAKSWRFLDRFFFLKKIACSHGPVAIRIMLA